MELVNKHTKDKMQLTRLISQMASNEAYTEDKEQIKKWKNTHPKDAFIFNLRVYNEEKMVGQVIDEIYAAGFSKIIAINDGSLDNSLSILQEKKKQYSDKLLIIASHIINRGGGAANQTGFNFIKKYHKELQVQWMVTYDADGQMNLKDMEVFQSHIQHHPASVYF
jgi:cellulose synthase/poly-beta-1,6-N-acetylglucosamine synthase-like glycosyltransferase